MRFNRRSLALCLAVPALVAAGCGGGSSDEDQIKDIVNEVANDPLKVCDHLSDATLKTVFNGDADDCRKAGEEANAADDAGDVKIESVKVDGDNATAQITNKKGEDQTLKFTRDGDEWLVAVE